MPIRAAVLTAEQMQEFTRTGKIPAGAKVEAFDDMGQALDSAVSSQASGVMAFTEQQLYTIADRAAKIATHAITEIDEINFKKWAFGLASQMIAIPPEHCGRDATRTVVEALRNAFLHGYTCAIGDVLAGKMVGVK